MEGGSAIGMVLFGLCDRLNRFWTNCCSARQNLPKGLRSLLIGLSFGFVASPCSTPVLVTLLAWVSGSGNLLVGTEFLLAYAIGSVLPLAIAGTFTGLIKQFLELRRWSSWLNWGSGLILIGFGTLSILSKIA